MKLSSSKNYLLTLEDLNLKTGYLTYRSDKGDHKF